MASAPANVLTINGGSSSIKFAVFACAGAATRILHGSITGVGRGEGAFTVAGSGPAEAVERKLAIPDHQAAVRLMMDWVQERFARATVAAVGHRVVHGGPSYWEPQRVTPELLAELRRLSPFDPEHLPEEILLIETIQRRFPHLPQVACFDTAFHHDLPGVARVLPIPRRYQADGVRRYGFHGLSYAYLVQELRRCAGDAAADGRVVIAHLGSGASMAALRGGRSVDTTMAFTPASGLVMGTRSGDLDPGLMSYLARSERLGAVGFERMVNHESGLLGVSGTSADMQELLAREGGDARAAEAIGLFCYQAKKCVGAYAAALGGLDTLVFAGGIGEHAAPVRARICAGLGFLGIHLDAVRNAAHAPVISADGAPATVRVIATDEELMIARAVGRVLGLDATSQEARP